MIKQCFVAQRPRQQDCAKCEQHHQATAHPGQIEPAQQQAEDNANGQRQQLRPVQCDQGQHNAQNTGHRHPHRQASQGKGQYRKEHGQRFRAQHPGVGNQGRMKGEQCKTGKLPGSAHATSRTCEGPQQQRRRSEQEIQRLASRHMGTKRREPCTQRRRIERRLANEGSASDLEALPVRQVGCHFDVARKVGNRGNRHRGYECDPQQDACDSDQQQAGKRRRTGVRGHLGIGSKTATWQ